MSAPPLALRFLGRTIRLQDTEGMIVNENKAGDCTTTSDLIRVDPAQSPIDYRDTHLHEVLHAISQLLCLAMSERQVCVTATALVAIFDDNPQFARFITSKDA